MNTMAAQLAQIDAILVRIEELAAALHADPDGHVRRSVEELRTAFTARGTVDAAVARVRESVRMLRRGNHDQSRREFQRRAPRLDHLEAVVDDELLPCLRRLGFDV